MRMPKHLIAFSALALSMACGGANESNRSAGNVATVNANANANTQPAVATTPAQAPTPDQFAETRGLYAQHCQRCHKPEGGGGIFEEQGLKPLEVPSLRVGSAVRHTDEQLARRISNGDDGMPAFKNKLTPEQINSLVAFIRSEFQGRTDGATGANASQPASAH